jgi:hypothetical protein
MAPENDFDFDPVPLKPKGVDVNRFLEALVIAFACVFFFLLGFGAASSMR